MAINAKNIINLSAAETPQLSEKTAQEVKQKKLANERTNNGLTVIRKKPEPTASESAVLVVNGKPRNIGRKSHYLLDMLTLNDE